MKSMAGYQYCTWWYIMEGGYILKKYGIYLFIDAILSDKLW